MKILVANIGSTSLKHRLYQFEGEVETLLFEGRLERVADYGEAIDLCLLELKDRGYVKGESELAAVGFKPVAAKGVTGCVEMDNAVLAAMEAYQHIAPAHNPPYINGIKQFRAKLPDTPMIGLFETAYYQWAPEPAQRYAVPQSWHEMGIRRWGFHGASHKYIAECSAELMGRNDIAEYARNLYHMAETEETMSGPPLRVISCHLGGSSSVTGILNGVAIGNSFGLTPQSGLPQNNRVGDLDSMAIPYLMRSGNLSLDEIEKSMAQESGLLGLSGVSNDLRDIQRAARQGNADAQLALDCLVHQTRHWIGSYFLQMNGADALVFTAGIGENDADIRKAVCADLSNLGIELKPDQSELTIEQHAIISKEEAKVKVFVIRANEELVVAREVRRYLKRKLQVTE